MRSVVSVLLLLAMVCGCASRKPLATTARAQGWRADGQVRQNVQQDPQDERYPMLAGVRFDPLVADAENAAPRYPEHLLAARLPPVFVTVRMIVDTEGAVTEVLPEMDGESVPQAFVDAVLEAVQSWRFSPLIRWQDGQAEALPWSEKMTFEFRQINDRAVEL
ncbi:hypothetical protein CO608_05895 [Lysobacteraceae bacterium NML08-0793]|nr:hypothetical protein CO608_05895 [Xanthomonadaceae bacterium NML08-0793]